MGGGTGGGEPGVWPDGALVGGVACGGGTFKPPLGGSGMSSGWSAGEWAAGGTSGVAEPNGCGELGSGGCSGSGGVGGP